MMAERLAARGFSPQRIITSPALRALRTAEAVAAAVNLSSHQIEIAPSVYRASVENLMQLIQELALDETWIALVGHNPELTMLACRLSGQSIENVPTCGVAESQFKTDQWQQIGTDGVALSRFNFDFPKNKLHN
jgi:phosphohistidine phosphatase